MLLPSCFFPGLALCISLAEATGLDPIGNLCSRWYHQSQVKNGVLYIDGGIQTFSDREPFDNPAAHDDRLNYSGLVILGQRDNYVIAVDLSKSWNWKTNISEVLINKTVALGTSNSIPKVQSGALFHGTPDDDQVYLYGGVTPDVNTSFADWQAPTTNQYTLWGFNTKSHEWTQYDVVLGAPERPSWGASAEAPEQGLAFYLNGQVTNLSSAADKQGNALPDNLGGMVVLDLVNHEATNTSTDSVDDGNPRVRGGMVYIPQIGNMGVLVSLGGATGMDASLRPVSLSQVNIFYVESSRQTESTTPNDGWYTQMITGEVPSPRVDFCLVVVSAPDNSSFNIYLYGGWDPTQTKYFDDIWVLSIPSFTWTKVYEGTLPRFAHTCHLVGNRQMITVGGINSTNLTGSGCDWEWMGVAILDLSTMEWGSIFDSNKTPYQVYEGISAVIGGGPDGGATKLLPDGGWTSTLVANLFTGTTNNTAPYSPKSGADGVTDNYFHIPSKTNVGAIVGGVVGGVALVAIAGGQCWWFSRRRRIAASAAAPTYHPEPPGEDKHQSPLGHQQSPHTHYEVTGIPVNELAGNREASELDGGHPGWYVEAPEQGGRTGPWHAR
ncbi:Uu.00g021660.m01.CDS01 [Anthostomella pinea]|uniref:Uu.00g021660.m01.CDS01 n=1 Tax=Anthostomella pinea TaxID=933095 RepID=A0AAI8VZR6_9PEZI|nr:Uu.00g021660.m01.CDS01 [Anthostomella pinea]